MELDRIFALAKIVKQRLNCSQQMSEYIASIVSVRANTRLTDLINSQSDFGDA